MEDPVWLALQNHYQVFHRVKEVDPLIYEAWCGFSELARTTSPTLFLSPSALVEMRKTVKERPLSSVAKISENGRAYVEREQAYREWLRLQDRKKKSARDRSESDKQSIALDAAARKKAKDKKEEMKREMEAALARLNAAFSGDENASATARDPSQRTVESAMLSLSKAAPIRILNSTSTKLDYILHEVRFIPAGCVIVC